MKKYQVYNAQGADLGVYHAEDEAGAIAAMLADAGYSTQAERDEMRDPDVRAKEVRASLQPLVLYLRTLGADDVTSVISTGDAFKIETVVVPYYPHSGAEPEFVMHHKLTVQPTEERAAISFARYDTTDEGSDAEALYIEQDGDERWLITSIYDGADCDGRIQRGHQFESSGAPQENYDNEFFPTMRDASALTEIDGWERDPVAEAARF